MSAIPHDRSPLIALVGNPNCGKTALFNLLTGSRQKVANYAGVTVERKEGVAVTASGKRIRILDLPGVYSLDAATPDEHVTCEVLLGKRTGEQMPDAMVCVTDATNLRQNLRLVLALRRLGIPMLLALNMSDLAKRRGLHIDKERLAKELGIPVVETVGVKSTGVLELAKYLDALPVIAPPRIATDASLSASEQLAADYAEVNRILTISGAVVHDTNETASDRIDRIVLHPILGPIILAVTLFFVFQAVFAWAQWPMDVIEGGVNGLAAVLRSAMPDTTLRSLLLDGVLAGVGSVLVFLPQILILFFFILILEDSGYLPRAAFLLDRLMGSVGLSGRSFIPLLSSFACAIPGVMATRTIQNPRDRLATIMIAPLMTCSARIPVYALIIGAFIPQQKVWGVFELQGVVLFTLYVAGVLSALGVAYFLKLMSGRRFQPLMLELPTYHWPHGRSIAIGLWQRVTIFLVRVGTIILSLMVLLWALSSYPAPPADATGPAIQYSIAGRLGAALAHVFAPIGFNWQISLALVPGLAAREVAVGSLGTVYSLAATGDDVSGALTPLIASTWSLPTALSLLAWYVFAPQCLSTIAAVKRETATWRYPLIMLSYLFALAYIASFITYHVALRLTSP
ncbi:MAG TPA: ferrous iron transporter B [Steroidobacteraceae bacterium]|nr:ferrous iron transporter B [Steroidobacteraceae bacterium]